ncbi:MAG: phosphate ABC transporter substrate-binding protein PstS, partial [Thermoplasmata archaeon]
MMRTRKDRLILVMLASVIISTTLLLTGCTNDNKIITIRTTGATFPQYQMQKWIDV